MEKQQILKTQKKAKNKTIRKLLVIGLGNPGENYRETRHNAGFAVIDKLSEKYNIRLNKPFFKPLLIGSLKKGDYSLQLVKPLTYMNLSGKILDYAQKKTGADINDILIICDNMDLKPGMIRLKSGGSSAGHNGIKSVIDYAGTADFDRLYVGVGRPPKGQSIIDHVLGCTSGEDLERFQEAVDKAADAVGSLLEKPINQVMNEINRKNS